MQPVTFAAEVFVIRQKEPTCSSEKGMGKWSVCFHSSEDYIAMKMNKPELPV